MAVRVLVADDSDDIVTPLVLLLQSDGHAAHGVRNGLDAIKGAETLNPQVAILDIGMPRTSGLDVCGELRTKPWGKNIHIVAISGWGQAQIEPKEAGFNAHYVKPI